MNDFGLKKNDIELISSVLAKYREIDKVCIFGSRAKGNFKNGSDIDLAVFTNNFNSEILSHLNNELDELPLPYKFDVLDYKKLKNNDLKDHIDKWGREIYFDKKGTNS